jgi:hypothetical protein
MSAMQNNPELKRESELLEQSFKKMKTYMKSAEYRLYLDLMKRNFRENFEFKDHIEKPEKPEKPQKPKKPEAPEKPDTTN